MITDYILHTTKKIENKRKYIIVIVTVMRNVFFLLIIMRVSLSGVLYG